MELVESASALVKTSVSRLDGGPEGPYSLLTWLQLAESLQLEALKERLTVAVKVCSAKMWGLILNDSRLETLQAATVVQIMKAALHRQPLPLPVFKCRFVDDPCDSTVVTATCSCNHNMIRN